MKTLFSVLAITAILSFVSIAEAQRPGGGRGGQRGGPPGGGQPQGFNQENLGGNQAQQRFGNQGQQGFADQAAENQNGNRNMPSVANLAQMMIANFDSDGSGELGQAELQSALTSLRQMMQNRGGQDQADQQQNGLVNQQNGGANQQNGFQGRQNLQGDQFQANRPPQRGQGRFQRAR